MGKDGLRRFILSAIFLLLALQIGCSEDLYIGTRRENSPPEIWLSSGPVEGDTTNYQVHFYWGGWDPDGEIAYFEFIVVDGDPIGFDQEDTTGIDKWYRTSVYDSVFRVTADDVPVDVSINNNLYTKYQRTHTFFIRGVDAHGYRSEPQYRSFTAWTLAPYVQIDRPADAPVLGRVITFHWVGRDPIDDPSNTQDPDSVRWLWGKLIDSNGIYNPAFDMPRDLNNNPWRYEKKWQPWISYSAPMDSGKETTIGDDEVLEVNWTHVFVVQAKDEAGAVTAIFDRDLNYRQFIVSESAGPELTITEPYLGSFRFLGRNFTPEKRDLPPGVPLNFHWRADASSYGGEIVGFRYGWNVADVSNPGDWAVSFSPFNLTAPERILYSGTHTFLIEVIDNTGSSTLAQIEINIVPFNMERNLFWVDDFYSTDFNQIYWAVPTETQHDQFWLDICAKVEMFIEEDDVYDVARNNYKPPHIERIGKYKNIIWTYSTTDNAWKQLVLFTPETQVTSGTQLTVNYISIFLAKGGHLWTCGRSDRGGGLAAVLAPVAQSFPMNLRCEITGNQEGCSGDTSGVYSMAYKDYCVTVLDKVEGIHRTGVGIPFRTVDHDALSWSYKDNDSEYNSFYPGLPDTLALWDEVTKSGRFFDPQVRGFSYVEIYNPEYWLAYTGVSSQNCFTPMYRMRTRNSISPVNRSTIAIWLKKHANVVPDIPPESGLAVAAPSVHFGIPLWFFDHEAVENIADVVFEEWQIKSE
jgi:hypothetical protein